MASLSNSMWQNRKECPNRSTNNGDMTEKAKRPWMSESGNKKLRYDLAFLLRKWKHWWWSYGQVIDCWKFGKLCC